ncbi:hypothetical protein MP228_009799 [Amoeboaphelidium protococcarum]|nr:hypothetical protein MP228_009799 [Amoeboaphelidium protococcarum]
MSTQQQQSQQQQQQQQQSGEQQHPITLKVMRLSRPYFDQKMELTGASHGDKQSTTSPTKDILTLPTSFGQVHLGETFSCYLCVNNDMSHTVHNVSFRVELHTQNQKTVLNDSSKNSVNLLSNQTVEVVVSYEIREVGVHVLVCTINYNNGQKLKKYYKFNALSPISVKTKVNSSGQHMFLEAQLQNLCQNPVFIERMRLEQDAECAKYYECQDLNKCPDGSQLWGDSYHIGSEDIRQYLFMLKPKHDVTLKQQVSSIGKLDILWRSTMCEAGRLQTSFISAKPVQLADVLSVKMLNAPDYVVINAETSITFRIANQSSATVHIVLNYSEELSSQLQLSYASFAGDRTESVLQPQEAIELSVEFVAVSSGVINFSCLSLIDRESQQEVCKLDSSLIAIQQD